jgi:predicted PurR-regulated permease PerM
MTLKPLIRWLSCCHIPPMLSGAVVLCLLVAAVGVGFFQLGRPALTWMNEAPQHMTELRQRVLKLFPRAARFSAAAAAVNNLGATDAEKAAEQEKTPTLEVKESHGTSSILNWTGTLLVGLGETLVLIYLLLASGDLFLQKLVRVMPTLSDKKRAVEVSHEIQQNISNYLFSVSLINIGLGIVVSGGLYFMGVPNAAMWGMLAAVLNFVPYFGPVAGVLLLATVGLLTFDTLWQGLLPPAWYLVFHLLEANLITPVLLGRRFTLNPVVIFVSLIFWMWLWGVPGALLSVPILVSIKVVCDRVPAMSPVSELLSR